MEPVGMESPSNEAAFDRAAREKLAALYTDRHQLRRRVSFMGKQIASLRVLLGEPAAKKRTLVAHEVLDILESSASPMRAREIAAEIECGGLVIDTETPLAASVASVLVKAVNEPDSRVTRVATGLYVATRKAE